MDELIPTDIMNYTWYFSDALSKALSLPLDRRPELSDQAFDADKPDASFVIPPWNKGLIGVQESTFKGKTGRYTDEQRKRISEGTKKAMQSIDKSYYETRDSCNDRRWMNKDGKHKRVNRSDIDLYKTQGWSEGRLLKRSSENGRFLK